MGEESGKIVTPTLDAGEEVAIKEVNLDEDLVANAEPEEVEEPEQPTEESSDTIAGLPVFKTSQKKKPLRLLIYGDPGVGKTTLAATAYEVPEMRPVLLIDVEGGIDSISDEFPDIDVIRIEDKRNKQGVITNSGWKQLEKLKDELLRNQHGYKTIIVDTAGEVYELANQQQKREYVAKDPDSRDLYTPVQRDYMLAGQMMRAFVRALRDTNAHVIMTAHLDIKSNAEGTVTSIRPNFPGKTAIQVAAFLGMVFKMERVKKGNGWVRRIVTQPGTKEISKERVGRLKKFPEIIEDPSIAKIVELAGTTLEL